MAEVRDGKLSGNEFQELSAEMEQDLIAVFKMMEDHVLNVVKQGVKEKWTVEQTVAEINKVLYEEEDDAYTQ